MVDISTVVCQRCRFVFQLEAFSDALLAALYRSDTSFNLNDAEGHQARIRAHLAERQAVISTALARHGIADGSTILDVGGGRGECCQHLAEQHRVVVADVAECLPADSRIERIPGLFSASIEPDAFDVVVMNHILEHVFSPTRFLESAHRVLRAGGILIVEVPFELYTPLVARHLGDWRHVAYFCRTTLTRFLEKSGFEVDRVVLAEGCYGVRRLPVIRATACKAATSLARGPIRSSVLVLAMDMLAPTVLVPLAKSRLMRR